MVRGAGQSIISVCVRGMGGGWGVGGGGGVMGGGGREAGGRTLPRRWCRMPGEAYTNVRTRELSFNCAHYESDSVEPRAVSQVWDLWTVIPQTELAFCIASPWYDRNGWLGVKHQITYLLLHSRTNSSSKSKRCIKQPVYRHRHSTSSLSPSSSLVSPRERPQERGTLINVNFFSIAA